MCRSILSFSAAALIMLAACTKVLHGVNSKATQPPAARVIPSILINGVERKPVVITISGTGATGNLSGRGKVATYNTPLGMAIDKQGNFYVADSANNMIRKITPGGTVTNFAGTGEAGDINGAALSAKFNGPTAVAVDTVGNVFVADRNNQRIRLIDINGNVSTYAGIKDSGYTDGPAASAIFHNPVGIAVDNKGNVYVSDEGNQRIRRINTTGNVATFAGNGTRGYGSGSGTLAGFADPGGLALDQAGNLYVADRGDNMIRKITPIEKDVTILAGDVNEVPGNSDGNGTSARFNNPTGIAVDSFGVVYVADAGNHLIRQITSTGDVTTIAGNGMASYADGKATNASFNNPIGVAVDKYGDVYVSDRTNRRIRALMVVPAVTTYIGTGDPGFTSTTLNAPGQMFVRDNAIFLIDRGNHSFREVLATGQSIATVSGTGTPGFRNGYTFAAQYNYPTGIAAIGNRFFISDMVNNMLRQFDYPTISTAAGNFPNGLVDGVGANARFDHPAGIAVDKNNTIIICDDNNNAIRRYNPTTGQVTTIAGGGSSALVDGQGTAARFSGPYGVVVDDSNNIFVADYYNAAIRKITPSGMVTTLAGGTQGYRDGVGRDAQFGFLTGLAIDAAGTLYVCDGSCFIRMITKAGVVTTLAGLGGIGYEEGPGQLARFQFPDGIAVTPDGKVYVSDSWNNVIRVIQ